MREILVKNYKMKEFSFYKTLFNNALVAFNQKFTGKRDKDRIIRKEKENARSIVNEFKYMGKIETLEQMHSYLRTNNFLGRFLGNRPREKRIES